MNRLWRRGQRHLSDMTRTSVGGNLKPGARVTVFREELVQAGDLARQVPAAIDASDARTALGIFKELPVLMLSPEQTAAVAQQLLRVIMSYQGWLLPRALREDLSGPDGVPALWTLGLPAPGAEAGGSQLLPLACDDSAYQALTNPGISTQGTAPVLVKSVVSGCEALADYVTGRLEGLVLNPGQEDELCLTELPQLRTWEATLRMEALLSDLDESSEQNDAASPELAALLAQKVKFYFVRTPDGLDLARDNLGRNFLVLTSLDAAALAAQAYGRQQVRLVTAKELLDMADQANGEFGFTFTLGPDRSFHNANAAAQHIPKWHTRKVTADWLTAALREGGCS